MRNLSWVKLEPLVSWCVLISDDGCSKRCPGVTKDAKDDIFGCLCLCLWMGICLLMWKQDLLTCVEWDSHLIVSLIEHMRRFSQPSTCPVQWQALMNFTTFVFYIFEDIFHYMWSPLPFLKFIFHICDHLPILGNHAVSNLCLLSILILCQLQLGNTEKKHKVIAINFFHLFETCQTVWSGAWQLWVGCCHWRECQAGRQTRRSRT